MWDSRNAILDNLEGIADLSRVDRSVKSKAFNDKKITAHFAIIPTETKVDLIKFSEKEERLYTVEYIESPEKKIRINSRILFNFNESNLLDNGKKTLDSIVDKVKGQRIQIVGHTDELGSKEYNFRLGKERADAARSYLISIEYSAKELDFLNLQLFI